MDGGGGGGGGGGMFGSLFEGIGGIIGGVKAERERRDFTRMAKVALNEAISRARVLWQWYQDAYMPLEAKMLGEAQAPAEQQPGFAESMGTVGKGYTDAASNMRRLMAGRYPSGSGLENATQQTLALNYPKAKSDVWNQYNQQRFAKMLQMANIGKGNPATAGSMTQGAAGTSGGLSEVYAKLTNENFQKGASGLGSFTDQLISMIVSGGMGGMGGGGGMMGGMMGGM